MLRRKKNCTSVLDAFGILGDLQGTKAHSLWLPATEGCFLVSGSGVNAEIGRNDLEHQKDKLTGFIYTATGCEGDLFHLCSDSHHIVFSQDEGKENLVKKLLTEEKPIAPGSVFIASGHVRHPGVECHINYCFCFQ